MRNTDVVVQNQNQLGGGGGIMASQNTRNSSVIHGSFRAISKYAKIVSSGASTVARSAVSAAASSIVDRDGGATHDQVIWAGFDKLEREEDTTRRVLLLGYRSGFQVWDVEEADNVQDLVSRYDGTVSFMQMLPKPIDSKKSEDKFSDSRPLLVLCSHRTLQDDPKSGSIPNFHDPGNSSFPPNMVRFYSLRSHSYVHMLKFRSVVHSVRCSSRVIAVALTAQIHCYNTTTLETEYTVLTNPIVTGCTVGYGPLAVGPRWLAYSGSPHVVSNTVRVNPQQLTPSVSFSNGVSHYAKESSKQLASGILTLGDAGYKKISRYCSDLLLESKANPGLKGGGAIDEHMSDGNNVGMVIVRDVVSKDVIAQFRAHNSPISALCFDPSGTLLVTASVQGHNIKVFKLLPDCSRISTMCDASSSYEHLYILQRGLTDAVIHDISFSYDSNWIMISSSKGTNHLFSINPREGSPNTNLQMPNQQKNYSRISPITLSAIIRIRNGTGMMNSLSRAIASTFHDCKIDSASYSINASLKQNYKLLVFSTGSMVQYALRMSSGLDSRLMMEPIQKWNICQKQTRRGREDNIDIYGEIGNLDRNKFYPEEMQGNNICFKSKVSKNPNENRHLYISEAELRMYHRSKPLWVKPEFYFQPMLRESMKTGEGDALQGEFEIETIQTRMIEARLRDLVPVQGFHLQQKNQRIFAGRRTTNGQQRPELSENSFVSRMSSSNSILQNDTELYNDNGETERDSNQTSTKANG